MAANLMPGTEDSSLPVSLPSYFTTIVEVLPFASGSANVMRSAFSFFDCEAGSCFPAASVTWETFRALERSKVSVEMPGSMAVNSILAEAEMVCVAGIISAVMA